MNIDKIKELIDNGSKITEDFNDIISVKGDYIEITYYNSFSLADHFGEPNLAFYKKDIPFDSKITWLDLYSILEK